jgi:phage-related protein
MLLFKAVFFNDVIRQTGIHEIIQYYQSNTNIEITLVDLRKYSGYPIKIRGIEKKGIGRGDPRDTL